MTPWLVRSLDVPAQRWRNGGGLTRELLAWPDAAAWRVRISVADVDADGLFSMYPGVQRWFTVLKGAGVELTVGDDVHRLERGDAPLCFAGEAPTSCRLLDGSTQDLNLMLRQATGKMAATIDGQAWTPDAAQCGLFTAVAGCCEAGEQALDVPAYALIWFDPAPPSLRFIAAQRPAALVGWWLSASPDRASA
ncbi:MAG: HutD family protein [Pseudomonadota bacterium]